MQCGSQVFFLFVCCFFKAFSAEACVLGHIRLAKKKNCHINCPRFGLIRNLAFVKGNLWVLSRVTLEIHPGGCFRKVFVFMGPLSPEGAGRGRGPVVLIMITINSVYFPTLPLLLAKPEQYITRVIPHFNGDGGWSDVRIQHASVLNVHV